jgi:hypothetical protein
LDIVTSKQEARAATNSSACASMAFSGEYKNILINIALTLILSVIIRSHYSENHTA